MLPKFLCKACFQFYSHERDSIADILIWLREISVLEPFCRCCASLELAILSYSPVFAILPSTFNILTDSVANSFVKPKKKLTNNGGMYCLWNACVMMFASIVALNISARLNCTLQITHRVESVHIVKHSPSRRHFDIFSQHFLTSP
ncbi:hypothetical protein J3E68DRAFT_314527 [Trichoderma sp. SZMC 28012]